MRGFLFAFRDDVPGNNAFMDLFRVGFVMLKKIKKMQIHKNSLDSISNIIYILRHRRTRRWRKRESLRLFFDRNREGKKTNLKYVSKMNRLGSSTDLKINSGIMDWGRKLREESSAFGPKNKSWRV